jgi:Na+/melibiose symporter-like transporter
MLASIGYALPALLAAFLFSPAGGLIQSIHAAHFGISLSVIAATMLAARVFDAAIDPLIGYASDRVFRARGERRTSVLFGCVWMLIAAAALWTPAVHASPAYFVIASFAYFIGWSLFDIPHSAWAAEASTDDAARATLYAWRTTALYLGNIGFSLLAFVPGAAGSFTPGALSYGMLVCLPFAVFVLAAMWRWGPVAHRAPSHVHDTGRIVLLAVIRNKPLLMLMATYLVAGFGLGAWFAIMFLYVGSYLGLSNQLGSILLTGTIAGIAGIPVWTMLIRRFEKKHIWAATMTIAALLMLSTSLIEPGSSNAALAMTAITAGMYFCLAGQNVIIPSVMADVIDYGRLRFGADRSGSYFAFFTMVTKANAGLGAAIAFLIAGWFGFDPKAAIVTGSGATGLQMAFAGLPAISAGLALALICLHPLTAKRRATVRRYLDRIDRRDTQVAT